MKTKSLLVVAFVCFGFTGAYSQQEIISTTTQYITAGKYVRADEYLDSILKKNPKCLDALVMEGNLLLNYAWQNTSKYYFDLERAESVLDTSARIDQSFFTPVIKADTSRLIERYWLQCLSIDSNRQDVQKGLCNLYSLSLRTTDLKARLLSMKSTITANPDNAFVYAEYARNLKARGKFEEGMEVYQLIADMFPDLAGIRCDMAGEYFYAGRMKEALQYLDSTLNEKKVDQTSFINSASIYSILGYYNAALKTYERSSAEDSTLSGKFYKGLLQFARMDTACYLLWSGFLQQAGEQNYYDEVKLTRQLLPYTKAALSLKDYSQLLNDAGIPDYYKVLIYQRGMQQYKDSCEPFMNYGLFECRNKNYTAAAQFLESAESCGNNAAEQGYRLMAGAYACYMGGEKEKALAGFNQIINAKNALISQAAKYFTARLLAEKGNKIEASELLEQIMTAHTVTKYRYLAAHSENGGK
jgi:Tfp pilus assembly protein PilF